MTEQGLARADSVLDITLLSAKTNKSDIRTRPGPHGMKFSYLPWSKVAERMNAAFGAGNWSRTIVSEQSFPGKTSKGKDFIEVVILVRVTTPQCVSEAYGGMAWYMDNPEGGQSDAAQGALSKGFRRACAPFGIGLDLYEDDEDNASEEVHNARIAMTSYIKTAGISNKRALEILNDVGGTDAKAIPDLVAGMVGKREEDKIWAMIGAIQNAISS